MAANLFQPSLNRVTDGDGNPVSGAKMHFYLTGTTTPATYYTNQAGTVAGTNPLVSDADGLFDPAYLDPDTVYRVKLTNASGSETYFDVDPVTIGDQALRTELIAGSGSGLIGWIVDATGAVLRTLRDKLLETIYITPADFGADKTGATNTTTTLKAFYDHCIETGRKGYVPTGTYKITPGQLLFDNGGEDKAWPDILTAGHAAVTYLMDSASSVDEPFIIITNGRAGSANPGGGWTGGDGKYWSGGSHGGVTFEDTGPAGKTNRHCFELQGWTYPKFGYMLRKGTGGGSGIYLPLALFNDAYQFNGVGANNPDACAVTQMDLEGIEVLYGRYTIENRNYVGMDSWNVQYARGIGNSQGGIFGTGQGCTYLSGSFGACAGWAWDDGTNLDAVGGAGNRNLVMNFEIDDCQYGIRVNRLSNSKFVGVRMNHRYNSSFTPLNTGEGFWPRQCYSIASGASSNAINLQFENIIHRIQPLEAGVDPAGEGGGPAYGYNALGTLLLTANPGSVVGVTYDHQYIDGAGLGVVPADWASGFTTSSGAIFKSRDETFFSSLTHSIAEVTYSGGAPTVVNTGMGGVGSIVPFNSERLDKEGRYSTATYGYTVPWSGFLEVTAKAEITVADATRVRMSFAKQAFGAGAYSTLTWIVKFKKGASSEVFDHPTSMVSVVKGDVVYLMMDQNTGSGTPMTPSVAASTSCTATYRMVGDR